MRLWDRVVADPGITVPNGCEAVDVTSVLSMVMDGYDGDWSLNDCLNMAPPFARYFMFGKTPDGIRNDWNHGAKAELGAFFLAERSDDADWHMMGRPVLYDGNHLVYGDACFLYKVCPDGSLRYGEDESPGAAWLGPNTLRCLPADNYPVFMQNLLWTMIPFFVATSIMHCKNTSLAPAPIIPRKARSKSKDRRSELSYSVLVVDPHRPKRTPTSGGSSHTASSQALHICRGHFKDYSKSGLFGKQKGVYWWPQTLKGDTSQGVRIKDYRIAL